MEQPLCGRLRGGNCVAGLQAREHLYEARAAVIHVDPGPLGRQHGLHENRNADLRRVGGVDAIESRRRHADDGHWIVVDEDLFADDGGVVIEAIHPILVAENH